MSVPPFDDKLQTMSDFRRAMITPVGKKWLNCHGICHSVKLLNQFTTTVKQVGIENIGDRLTLTVSRVIRLTGGPLDLLDQYQDYLNWDEIAGWPCTAHIIKTYPHHICGAELFEELIADRWQDLDDQLQTEMILRGFNKGEWLP